MKFCRDADADNEGWMWLDLGNGHAHHLDSDDLCGRCEIDLAMAGLEDKIWRELRLCEECSFRVELGAAISDLLGENPYILDPEPELLSADPPSPPEMVPEGELLDPYPPREYPTDFYSPGPGFFY